MDISLNSFKNSFEDFCRPNRFIFSILSDDNLNLTWQEQFEYMCKGCSIPGRTIGDIPVNWQGMVYHMSGDPSFEQFTATFYNDVSFELRQYFEKWIDKIANMVTNERDSHELYANLQISQLYGDGSIGRIYNLMYAKPITISEIELDWESNDQIQTFTVTFVYSFITMDTGE